MTKVIKFPVQSPEKFGLQRVQKKSLQKGDKTSQLPLFIEAKVIPLNRISSFDEALHRDEAGDLNEARKLYERAIKENDSVADAYCNLGILESELGNHTKAIDCFTQCLKHEPRHPEAHYNLANLYAEVSNYGLAKVHFQICIEIDPDFSNSYFNLGLTLAMLREFKEAVKMLYRYREMTPQEDHQQVDDLIRQLTDNT